MDIMKEVLVGILMLLVNYATVKFAAMRANKQGLHDMILALGRRSLLQCCKRYKEIGYIPLDEHDAFDGLYKSYINMGGNGTVKKLYEEVEKLPIEDK